MKASAHAYCKRVTNGDVDSVLELFADEDGIQGKAALRLFYEKLISSFVD